MNILVGSAAPNFSALDQNGNVHFLAGYRNHWILLYFYPKDFTSGCTTEACGLRDNFKELGKRITILGVSADSVTSHKEFAHQYNLPFTLLADPERKIINLYGANGVFLAKRVSFLIDPTGKIAKIYNQVNPTTHVAEIIHHLKRLQ